MALMMVPSGLKAETAEMLQTSKITGVVIDDFGEPIIGATVRVKNAQNGAVTDVNGRYSVNATKNATLVFSFIGYRTQEVAVKGRQLAISRFYLDDRFSNSNRCNYSCIIFHTFNGSHIGVEDTPLQLIGIACQVINRSGNCGSFVNLQINR